MNPIPSSLSPAAVPRIDPDRVRQDFPILSRKIRGRPLVYLDNAATTQRPTPVIEAVRRFYAEGNANIHRGIHFLSQEATSQYEGAREVVRRFLGAESPEEIVFVRGATEGINLVARSFVQPRLRPGDEVVISHLEHHSNIVPWQLVCQESGAVLRVAAVNDRGEIDLEHYRSLLGSRTRFVSMAHVSNALGTINPVRAIVAEAHRRDIPVLLDGAQGAGHGSVDVRQLGCDFYVFSGHKVYGPTGIGALFGKREHLDAMPPWQGGGDMIRSVSFSGTTYAPPPHRFEAGTPNIAGALGLAEAVRYVTGIGREAIARYEAELLEYATRKTGEIDGLRIVGTAREKASIVSFVFQDVHPHDIGTILDQDGIAVRAGHHCAQPLMERFGLSATTRASFAFYNTREEIDAFAAALQRVRELFN